jgi:hypothetical protein
LGLTLPAQAQTPAPPPAVVWYRASEQCPNGAAFLARLADKSSRARLAEPADHFDFLVTLVAGGGETVGRLERQTQSGTVAIRELRDRNCERVADALALGLSLALEPSSDGAARPATEPEATGATDPDDHAETIAAATPSEHDTRPSSELASATAPSSGTPEPSPPTSTSARPRDIGATPHDATPSPWSLGLAGEALEGSMPKPIWLGSLGVDYTWRREGAARMLFAVTGVGGYGSAPTQVGLVQHWLAAGRAELCPYFLGSGRVELWPCGAVEVGALGASDSRPTGLSARDLWAAPGASLRLKYPASGSVAVSLRAAALVPLVRETVYAGTASLYSAEIIVFQAGLGVTARLW